MHRSTVSHGYLDEAKSSDVAESLGDYCLIRDCAFCRSSLEKLVGKGDDLFRTLDTGFGRRRVRSAVAAGRRDLNWDRFDPLFTSVRNTPEFQRLSDPRARLAGEHAGAEPIVRRVAATFRTVDEQFGRLLLVSPAALADLPSSNRTTR